MKSKLKYLVKKIIPYILLVYFPFGAYKTVDLIKELKSISLPDKDEMTRINKILMQKEGEKELTEQEREVLILRGYKYNYIELTNRIDKFRLGFFGVSTVLSLFVSIYLLGKRELKSHGY